MGTETDIKAASLKLISMLGPEAGFLSIFIGLLWPTNEQEDPWDKVKERTEKLINDRLDQNAWSSLKQRLTGLKGVLEDYNREMVQNNPPEHKYGQYVITHEHFRQEIPSFQDPAHARILLPLFMQCANLHLLLMKHAYNSDPQKNGFTAAEIENLKKDLDMSVDKYIEYAQSIIKQGPNIGVVDPCNLYVQQLTIDVSDYLTVWPYMKSNSKGPTGMPLPREVYSEKVGVNNPVSPDNAPQGPGYFQPVPAGEKLTRVRIWGGGALDAVEEWHGTMDTTKDGYKRGGPGGKPYKETYHPYTATPCDIDLTKRTITAVRVYYTRTHQNDDWGDLAGGIEFTLDDNTTHNFLGSDNWILTSKEIRVPDDHYISSINVISVFNDAQRGHLTNDLVRTLYFGFKFKPDVFQ